MSNPLHVRRVRIQDIDAAGNDVGEPIYGILASDSEATVVNAGFETREEMEAEIAGSASILAACTCGDEYKFLGADHEVIGWDNFYGKGWLG
jgi:hypothetical protein